MAIPLISLASGGNSNILASPPLHPSFASPHPENASPQEEQEAAATKAAERSVVSEAISSLDNDSYNRRQAAAASLFQIGERAVEAVIEILFSSESSAEQKTACKKILIKWMQSDNFQLTEAIQNQFAAQEAKQSGGTRALISEELKIDLGIVAGLKSDKALQILDSNGVKVSRSKGRLQLLFSYRPRNLIFCVRLLTRIDDPFELRFASEFDQRNLPWESLSHSKALRHLTIDGPLKPSQLIRLGDLPQLESLSLPSGLPLSAEQCKQIEKYQSLRNLKISTDDMHPSIFRSIGKLTNLTDLKFGRSYSVGAKDIKHLASLRNLKTLNLDGTYVTGRDIQSLAGLPKVTRFVSNNVYMGDNTVDLLRTLPKLQHVSLTYSRLTDDGVAELAKISGVKSLNVSGCVLTDACIDDLLKMKDLEDLELSSTYISDEGMLRIQNALPNTELVLNKSGTLPPKTLEIFKRLSKLGIRCDRSNSNVAIYVNSPWRGNNEDLVLAKGIEKNVRWGINIEIDDDMGEALLKVKPGMVYIGKSRLDKLSDDMRKKLKAHHISWQNF